MSDENAEESEFLDDEEDFDLASFSWSKDRTMFLLASYMSELQAVTSGFFANVAEQIGADHNSKVDAETFRQEAAKEIETIFKEPTETTDG